MVDNMTLKDKVLRMIEINVQISEYKHLIDYHMTSEDYSRIEEQIKRLKNELISIEL